MLKVRAEEGSGARFLLQAMSQDKAHLARFVLDALDGQIVDAQADGSRTPLICSVRLPDAGSRRKFTEMLLRRGANVNLRDAEGRTALSHACERGYLDAVEVLVRNNADPEVADAWGNSALMYAAVAGHSPVVEFLVRAFKRLGLRVDRQNDAGNSAVEVARFLGHAECFCALTGGPRRRGSAAGRGASPERGAGESGDVEQRVGRLADHLERVTTREPREPRGPRGPRWPLRLPSMDSIEEFDREPEPLPCKVKPPLRAGHLPPLGAGSEPPKPALFSPRPRRSPPAPSALRVLLTPHLGGRRDADRTSESSRLSAMVAGRCPGNLYRKRCSLPCGVPGAPAGAPRRRGASPSAAEPPPLASTAALSAFGNRLLRRFTSPEIKKGAERDEATPRRIPRSETFPQSPQHPAVGGKPSVESISSVRCEFDLHQRRPRS